jgi:predicted dehydrogenase
MKARILIVGVGSIGKRHLQNLWKLGFRDIALCDTSREKLAAARRLGHFRAYRNMRIALKTEKPFAVFVCNPTHLHVPSATLSLQSGAHVFIEKPISHTLKGVDELARAAEKRKRMVMVACNFRFQNGFRRLEKLVRQKRFGAPLVARVAIGYFLPAARKGVAYKSIYAARKGEGGVALDSGSHALDYLTALFGKAASSVALKGELHPLGIQSEEAAALMIRHRSGVLSSITLDYVSRKPTHRIEIVTDKGVLALDVKKDILTFEDERAKKVVYRGTGNQNTMFIDEARHFLRCARRGLRPLQDIAAAKETLRVLLSASHNQ